MTTVASTDLVVDVQDLRVSVDRTSAEVVAGVDLALRAGEIVALVGESGSGKTTVGSALLGYVRPGATISGGRVWVGGQDVLALNKAGLSALRGRVVSYVPQDPGTALNPVRRIGDQLREALRVHGVSGPKVDEAVTRVLAEVHLPSDRAFLRRFPHQLSGGQQQRLVLAMAFVLRPRVIVLDEPTTGLDVTTQAHVIETVRELCARHGAAALYVTHDLAVVRGLADRVVVLYGGRVVESARAAEIFAGPRHPYTRGLLAAIPDVDMRRVLAPIAGQAPPPGARPDGCGFSPRCPHRADLCDRENPPLRAIGDDRLVRCCQLETIPISRTAEEVVPVDLPSGPEPEVTALRISDVRCSYGSVEVVHGVSFSVSPGRCLALVGESGSGKSTLSKTLVGLLEPAAGEILLRGERVQANARKRPADVRRQIQYVFQNPYRSLNPRLTVRQSLALPVKQFFDYDSTKTRHLIDEALERVALPSRLASARPRDLSGGERQRAAIARALLCKPSVLLCDEVTSALDVSVQAAIIRLLDDLRRQEDLALIFVTHNLGVVRAIADDVVVLQNGHVVESGAAPAVLDSPSDSYTRALLADTPRLRLQAEHSPPTIGAAQST